MKNLKIGVSNLSKRLLFISLLVLVLGACKKQDANDKKVWAWMSGKTTLTATEWDHYFKEASNAGIDAILPYGLHESRNVVQDRVYPLWDFCYCEVCRSNFKEMTGLDPLELEDPTSNLDWMQYRWEDASVLTATQEGVQALSQTGNGGYLCSGLFIGHVPIDRISEFFNYAQSGGSKGVALFSLEGIDKTPGYWEKLKEAIAEYKN